MNAERNKLPSLAPLLSRFSIDQNKNLR